MEFKLKECREKRGLSIRQLAMISSVSASEISQIENGIIRNPSLKTYCKICRGLKINAENEILKCD